MKATVGTIPPMTLVPGPVPGTVMTPGYARAVAQMAYAWGWPMVNIQSRRLMYTQVPTKGRLGPMPVAPLNELAMLADYIDPDIRVVAHPVGSRTGAPTVGSGGSSKAFAVGLSPAPLVTFPAPASSNPAYGFPVLGFPGCFAPRVMGPIRLRALSAWAGNHKAVAYSTSFRHIQWDREKAEATCTYHLQAW